MKTLALQGGDLVVGAQGHSTITGSHKIRQDLALALGEPYGSDRFHPGWGSVLPDYVGQPLDEDGEMLVRTECNRVVQLYIDTQRAEILNDALAGKRSRFTTADVVSRLLDIETVLFHDTIRVKLSLLTEGFERLTVSRAVTAA